MILLRNWKSQPSPLSTSKSLFCVQSESSSSYPWREPWLPWLIWKPCMDLNRGPISWVNREGNGLCFHCLVYESLHMEFPERSWTGKMTYSGWYPRQKSIKNLFLQSTLSHGLYSKDIPLSAFNKWGLWEIGGLVSLEVGTVMEEERLRWKFFALTVLTTTQEHIVRCLLAGGDEVGMNWGTLTSWTPQLPDGGSFRVICMALTLFLHVGRSCTRTEWIPFCTSVVSLC